MVQGVEKLLNPFRVYELRKRILFTLGIIAISRIGCFIPAPGIDGFVIAVLFNQYKETLLGFINIFSGGALEQCAVLGLNIVPYINASIIMSLLTHVSEYLKRVSKEGEAGRKKINQYTRYLTLLIALIQSIALLVWFSQIEVPIRDETFRAIPNPSLGVYFLIVITLTTGAMFTMWLGEQITERGIGNGSSVLIFANILAALPAAIQDTLKLIFGGEIKPPQVVVILCIIAGVLVGIITILQAYRKITVEYARKVIGRRMYAAQTSFIPLQINAAGVIPVIFASAILQFFFFANAFLNNIPVVSEFLNNISQSVWDILQYSFEAICVFCFTYFYTFLIFKPEEVAENLRKNGGFIPGIRPGKATSEYINKILLKITFVGALFLVLVNFVPTFSSRVFGIPGYFSGTSLLILIGVALDSIRQIESYLLTSHYEGFIKKARIRGRFGF